VQHEAEQSIVGLRLVLLLPELSSSANTSSVAIQSTGIYVRSVY